jgi:hypothetical protein
MSARQLFDSAFGPGVLRNRRSTAYKAGVLAWLRKRLGEASTVDCPYAEGSAECDAFGAGVNEARLIWKKHQERRKEQPGCEQEVA